MGDVLAIARDTTLTIYEFQEGFFKEVALVELAKMPNDDTIVQIVTALAQVQHSKNGSTPPKKAPRTARKSTPKTVPIEKRSTEDKPRIAGFLDADVELKAIGGFDTQYWRTIRDAHDLMDRYANVKSFGSNVRRAFELGLLERTEETREETQKRLGSSSGRAAFLYRLTDAGLARLKVLGDASTKTQEVVDA